MRDFVKTQKGQFVYVITKDQKPNKCNMTSLKLGVYG